MGNIWENALSMWIILGLNWIKGVYDVDNMYRIIIKVFKWVYEWDNTGIGYIIWYYIYRVYKLMVKVDLWRDNKLNPMLYAITGIITRHFPNSFGWKTTASCTHFFLFWAVFFQVFGVCVCFVFFFGVFFLSFWITDNWWQFLQWLRPWVENRFGDRLMQYVALLILSAYAQDGFAGVCSFNASWCG